MRMHGAEEAHFAPYDAAVQAAVGVAQQSRFDMEVPQGHVGKIGIYGETGKYSAARIRGVRVPG